MLRKLYGDHKRTYSLTNFDSTLYTANGCNWATRPCCSSPYKYHILLLCQSQFQISFLYQTRLFSCTSWHKLLSVSSLLLLWFPFEVAIRREIWHLFMNSQKIWLTSNVENTELTKSTKLSKGKNCLKSLLERILIVKFAYYRTLLD